MQLKTKSKFPVIVKMATKEGIKNYPYYYSSTSIGSIKYALKKNSEHLKDFIT